MIRVKLGPSKQKFIKIFILQNNFYISTPKWNGFNETSLLTFCSYTNTTWSVSCPSADSGVCRGTKTQPIYIHSSVKFTEIPPQTPDPIPKYVMQLAQYNTLNNFKNAHI